jgi:2-amino-4-hydroxy-6-hydroxymethyldihydropteridine diphosphokinase
MEPQHTSCESVIPAASDGRIAGPVALVALGANLPFAAMPPAETLRAALAKMAQAGFADLRASRLWHTPCFPPGAGPDYVNAAAAAIWTGPGEPAAALAALHRIEARFGRARVQRWGMRTLDLDLLALGQAVRPDAATQTAWRRLPFADQPGTAPDRAILPHPRLADRAFVLAPLAEVAPHWRHPLTGRSVAEMLAALPAAAFAGMAPL